MGILTSVQSSLSVWATSINTTTLLWTIAQVSAGLFAVALTLVALVPTLVEIARVKSASYLSGDTARRRLKGALRRIGYAIWIYGIVTMLCLVGPVVSGIYVSLAVLVLFAVGIGILIHSGHLIAQITRSVI